MTDELNPPHKPRFEVITTKSTLEISFCSE